MKERPILFSSSMVRAILEGRKWQTRRVVKPQPNWNKFTFHNFHRRCPYGQPGDRLWVRETWRVENRGRVGKLLFFAADPGSPVGIEVGSMGTRYATEGNKYRPSIHMPRWASRITLEVTEVRVQRLQDIQEADALAEGVTVEVRELGALDPFKKLWDSINGKRPGFAWKENPWVWCVSFKRLEKGHENDRPQE